MGAFTDADGWRPMEIAHRDGRHVILRLRDGTDWSLVTALWCGGGVGSWSEDEDSWWVRYDASADCIDGGTGNHYDSHWFTGWKPLPDAPFGEAA